MGLNARNRVLTVVLVVIVCAASRLAAQTTTGSITGRVLDQTGAVVPGVKLDLTETQTNVKRSMNTNVTGDYTFSVLPPGQYSLSAEASGFRTAVQPHIVVQTNEVARLDIVMQPGQVKETVEVMSEPPAIRTENAELGDVVESKKITELPLNGRNFIQLVALEPGAHSITKNPGGDVSFVTSVGGGGYSVHGMSANATEFLYDGMSMRDLVAPQVGINPTVDAIQEFKFQSSNFSAAFGATAGGLINISSKSGTNQFHGGLWEFFRNNRLDARNYFETSEQLFQRNQFGGAFGGPIKKDKMFFFFTYEGLRRRKGVSRAVTVPTAAERAGDFSASGTPIKNPITGVPYPGNIIPAAEQDPVGRAALLTLFPAPNLPGSTNNLQMTPFERNSADQYNFRFDYNASAADLFFVRYSDQSIVNLQPWGSFIQLPNYFQTWDNPARNVVISQTHVFGTKMVNEAKFGYNWFHNDIEDTNKKDINAQLGIDGLSHDPSLLGAPNVLVLGYPLTGVIGNAPNLRNNHTWKIWDNLSVAHGSHSIAMGVNWLKYQQNGGAPLWPRGLFVFAGSFSGNPVADLMLGYPLSAQRCCVTGTAIRHFRKTDLGMYVQDDWRVRSNLVVNLGIRWDRYGAVSDTNNLINEPDISKAPQLVIRTAGQNGVPRGLRNPYNYNIAPRVGFAYSIGADRATVVRGGFGIFYNSQAFYLWGLNQNPPFTDNLSVASNPLSPQITLANPFPTGLGVPSSAYVGVNPKLRDPEVQSWNLDLQRQLPLGLTVSATYVGNHGLFLWDTSGSELNSPRPGPGDLGPRRPIPSIASYSEYESHRSSWYHAVEFKAKMQAHNGLNLLASYVRSKALDEGGNNVFGDGSDTTGKDAYSVEDDKGYSDYDQPNRFVASFLYPLPFGKGRSGILPALVSGWTVQGIVTIESGQPFTVILPYDNSNTGPKGFGPQDRPDAVPGQNPNAGPKTTREWFNKAAFQAPVPYTFGNEYRNSVRGPAHRGVDFSVHRYFKVKEGQTLQFRGEFFNLFNHPDFLQPGNVFGSPSEGAISGALDPRDIQLSLKYTF